jgi:predicted nuclease of predicted toxin-antitoxin system
MPRTIRFHLDEHVTHAVAAGLRRLGVDVTTTVGAGLLGAADQAHLDYALAEGRVVYTEDEDFLTLVTATATHAGLAYCRRNTRSIGAVIRALELIWQVYEPDEMRNRVEYV